MAAISGYSGAVSIGPTGDPTALVIIKSWDFEDSADTEDVTGMASGATGRRSFAATLTSWTASVEGLLDADDTHWAGSTDPLIQTGDPCDIALYFDPDDAALAYSGSGVITGVKPSCSVDGVVSFSLEIQGTGAPTYPVVTP